MEGYIKLARKITDSTVFDNPSLLKTWVWILCKAAHKDCKQLVGLQEVDIKKGQLIFGRVQAAKQLKMKESSVYKFIKVLEKMNMITVKSNNKFSLINVVNWGIYQDGKFKTEQQRNNNVTTKEQQRNTNKNDNNDKNDKNNNNAHTRVCAREGVPACEPSASCALQPWESDPLLTEGKPWSGTSGRTF